MKPPYKYTKASILLDAHKNSTTKLQKEHTWQYCTGTY